MEVEGIRVGSLSLIDYKPRILTIKEKACLLDLADAVSAIITARYREASNLSRQKMISVLNMAHHVRTPLMSATLANSTLAQDCTKLINMNTLTTQGAAVAHRMRVSLNDLQKAFASIEAAVSTIISEADTAHKDATELATDKDRAINNFLLQSCTQPMASSIDRLLTDSIDLEASLRLHTAVDTSLRRGSVKHSSHIPGTLVVPKPVVLVVEDSVIILKGMKRFLESAGCVVHTAINGKVGLELMTTFAIDAVFVDFLMVCNLH